MRRRLGLQRDLLWRLDAATCEPSAAGGYRSCGEHRSDSCSTAHQIISEEPSSAGAVGAELFENGTVLSMKRASYSRESS